jgi:hypothetical protein
MHLNVVKRNYRIIVYLQFRFILSLMETCQLLLYMEVVATCSENRTKHAHVLCGNNVVFCNVKHSWYMQLTLGSKG